MEPAYKDIRHINVNGEMYQIRSVDEAGNKSFIIIRSGDMLCRLSIDKNGQWKSDCDIGEHLLSGFVAWIKRLYGQHCMRLQNSNCIFFCSTVAGRFFILIVHNKKIDWNTCQCNNKARPCKSWFVDDE